MASEVQDDVHRLEQSRKDAERVLYMLNGAIKLLEDQEQDSSNSVCCGVCQRPVDVYFAQVSSDNIRSKQQTFKNLRNDQAVESYVDKMEQHGLASIPLNSTRIAYYMRTGALSEWRQQKTECIANHSCFACTRQFESHDLAHYLRWVDRRACLMERDLHSHPKYCPPSQPHPTAEITSRESKRMKQPLYTTKNERTNTRKELII